MKKARPFKALHPLNEAISIMMDQVRTVDRTESVPLMGALGRILAEDIDAPIDVPPFDRAVMDGYAVQAEDTFGAGDHSPKTLKVVGALYAGDEAHLKVTKGQCVKIATGAMMVEGSDSVVMVEYTEANDGEVKIFKPVHPGANVSYHGADMEKGTRSLNVGTELVPSKIGVVAALGIAQVEVYARPKIAVSATGNEIAGHGKPLRPGQVYDINTYTLSTLIEASGGEAIPIGYIEDTKEALSAALDKGLEVGDAVALSGGSSVGERDLLADVYGSKGEILVHGVQLKPGKPTLAAVMDGKMCFGFPGYPTACLVSAFLFLAPAVRKMGHRKPIWPSMTTAKIARRTPSTLGRTQILTVRLEEGLAHTVFKESGTITSLAKADGYIMIPANVDLVEKDEVVDVYLL